MIFCFQYKTHYSCNKDNSKYRERI
jgi:hypothetical protein